MKYIIILADGSADWHCEELGGKTLYQYASVPNIDLLASRGRTGMLRTIPDGFPAGSEVANSTILGYDQRLVYQGRGVLEAASIGYEMQPGDMAMRCNIVCIDGKILKNHSAGHISTPEAGRLIDYLNEKLASDKVRFYTGVQYRHLLVVSGGNADIDTTPPHDVPMKEWRPLLIKARSAAAQPTADLLNELILKSQTLLARHPVNLARLAQGKDAANSIWPWSPGYRPNMAKITESYPQIKSGAVISAVDLIRGIGRYAGLRVISVEGATGLFDTNYEGKAQAAIDALSTDDFVYLHIEAPDEAGHEGNLKLKLRTIEDIDKRVVGPVMEETARMKEPVSIAFLPDHPTPCVFRTHTNEPVPFVIYKPGQTADDVLTFDEDSCQQGAYGVMDGMDFLPAFLN
ncbi:MAG: cofactor-independent phosphoglycerate mutase [Prevotella sp.]|nr:cofactor-independent phosphoglycerate mutase [Prevotella sp.]